MLNIERKAGVRLVRTPSRLSSRWLVRAGLVLAAIVAAVHSAMTQTPSGLCHTFQYPGALATYAFGINNRGDVVGDYATSLTPEAERFSGYLRTADGQFSSINADPFNTSARGINDAGQIVGLAGHQAFVVNNGAPSRFSVGPVTGATGINNAGAIIGYYHINPEPGFRTHGFLLSGGGGTTTIDFPGDGHTWLFGINNHGKAVGWSGGHSFTWLNGQTTAIRDYAGSFTEASGINNDDKIIGAAASNFVLSGGRFSTFGCPGLFTQINGINDKGQIVGTYYDPNGGPPGGFFTPPVALLDPVPDLVSEGHVTTRTAALAIKGRDVQGIAADGVSEVVLRIPADQPGEQVTVTVLTDAQPPLPSTSADDDGAVGATGATEFTSATITVTAEGTDRGPMAFAVYRAPLDFPRSSVDDSAKTFRDINLRIRHANGNEMTLPLRVVRPLVALIHGIWDSWNGWDAFAPLVTGPSTVDPRFTIMRVSYDDPVPIAASRPIYPRALLANARRNALGFEFNAPNVRSQISRWLEDFKTNRNPANISVASVQADIVAHSMGGNIARTLVLDQNFLSDNTYKQGFIHKLITIDSPHQGTVLARRLLSDPNTNCLHQLFAKNKLMIFDRVTLQTAVGVGLDGAIRDLVDVPLSPASARITNLSPHPLRVAMIAGIYTNFDRLDWHPISVAARNKPFGCPETPLAQALTSAGWRAVFSGEENDGIVSRTSQWNGLTGGIRVDGVVHSPGPLSLGFAGPSALATRAVSTLVIDLLNTPKNSPFYVNINP